MANEESSIAYDAVNSLWSNREYKVELGEHLTLYINDNYCIREIKMECNVCCKEPDFAGWSFMSSERTGWGWIVKQVDRLFNEHNHTGSKTKSAGKH